MQLLCFGVFISIMPVKLEIAKCHQLEIKSLTDESDFRVDQFLFWVHLCFMFALV